MSLRQIRNVDVGNAASIPGSVLRPHHIQGMTTGTTPHNTIFTLFWRGAIGPGQLGPAWAPTGPGPVWAQEGARGIYAASA